MDTFTHVDLTPAQAWALVQEAQAGRERARAIYMDRTASVIARELAAARWVALGEAIALITGMRQDLTVAEPEPARPVHTVRGKVIGPEGSPYGVTHDSDCPGCIDTPFTASPRSETYWSS